MLDTDDIRQEIDVALETTRRHGIGGCDHLCCGAMGRVDTMIEGACRLNRQDLLDAAHQQAASLVRRARRAGGYETQTGRGMTDPGFFSGISGIGYTLLRLIDPDALPSVLLWD